MGNLEESLLGRRVTDDVSFPWGSDSRPLRWALPWAGPRTQRGRRKAPVSVNGEGTVGTGNARRLVRNGTAGPGVLFPNPASERILSLRARTGRAELGLKCPHSSEFVSSRLTRGPFSLSSCSRRRVSKQKAKWGRSVPGALSCVR